MCCYPRIEKLATVILRWTGPGRRGSSIYALKNWKLPGCRGDMGERTSILGAVMVRAGLEPESIRAGAGAFHRPAPGHLPGAGPSPTGQTCCKHSEDGSSQMGRALGHLDSSVSRVKSSERGHGTRLPETWVIFQRILDGSGMGQAFFRCPCVSRRTFSVPTSSEKTTTARQAVPNTTNAARPAQYPKVWAVHRFGAGVGSIRFGSVQSLPAQPGRESRSVAWA